MFCSYFGKMTANYWMHNAWLTLKDGKMSKSELSNLLQVNIGDSAVLKYVKDSSVPFLKYLNKIDLSLGDRIELVDREPYDDSLKIRIHNQQILISKNVAGKLFVKNT